jgi:hypothetical protein
VLIFIRINGESVYVTINEINEKARIVEVESVITVKYEGTNVFGQLLRPIFVCRRKDLVWNNNKM